MVDLTSKYGSRLILDRNSEPEGYDARVQQTAPPNLMYHTSCLPLDIEQAAAPLARCPPYYVTRANTVLVQYPSTPNSPTEGNGLEKATLDAAETRIPTVDQELPVCR